MKKLFSLLAISMLLIGCANTNNGVGSGVGGELGEPPLPADNYKPKPIKQEMHLSKKLKNKLNQEAFRGAKEGVGSTEFTVEVEDKE